MPSGTPTPEALLALWKGIAVAGEPVALAEALARGAARALGDVGGVLYRLPDGRWEVVVHGPEPLGLWRGEATGLVPSAGDSGAPWLRLAPRRGDLGDCVVAPLSAGGDMLGSLAVARLRREGGDGAIADGERTLLSRIAEAAAPSFARVARGAPGHAEVTDPATSGGPVAPTEQQLHFIADALPELLVYVDMQERLRFANRAYEWWFGQARESALGRPLREVVGPDTYQAISPHLVEGLAGKNSRFDLKLSASGGQERDVRVSLAVQRNLSHEAEGMVLLFADMTEQKRAEERLRFLSDLGALLHERLEDLAAESGSPLKTVAALSAVKLADWSVVEIRGMGGQLEQLAAAHADVEKTPALRKLQRWLVAEDGPLRIPGVIAGRRAVLIEEITDRHLEESVSDPEDRALFREVGLRSAMVVPVTTRSGTIGAIVLVAGRTRRQYDEADLAQAVELSRSAALATDNADLFQQKSRAVELRDNFLATASHELRTPLTSLGLHLDALLMEAEELTSKLPDLKRFISSLTRAVSYSERLGGLIRQLLDVARVREGTQPELQPELVDLRKVAADVLERFGDEAVRARCALERSFPEKPVMGYWDVLRLDQVITNLLGNALKYGAGKPVRVVLSTAGNTAVLVVHDQGIGIAPEDQERIFQKFERAVSPRHYGGLGLGLWIARRAVDAMRGTIRVRSTPGVQTTFSVELPLDSMPG